MIRLKIGVWLELQIITMIAARVNVFGSYRLTIPFPVVLLSEGEVLPIVLVARHILVEGGACARPRAACRQQSIQDRHRQLPPVVQRAEHHMKAPLLDEYDHMGIISGGVAVPLDVHPVDEALGVLGKQLLHEPVVLGHRDHATIVLPLIGLPGSLGPHRVVLGSVRLAPVKAQLNAPRGEHLEAVALVGLQGLRVEVGIEILGHYKISFCS